jgi:glutamyl-tRNA synthetase
MDDQTYLQFVKSFVKTQPTEFRNSEAFETALLIFKPQLSYASQIDNLLVDTFLNVDFEKISEDLKMMLKTENFQKCLKALQEILKDYSEITLLNGNEIVDKVKQQTMLKGKDLYLPIRFAAIAKEHGPEMNKILAIVGKETIINNLKKIIV